MKLFRLLFLVCAFLSVTAVLSAQDSEVRLGLRGGDNSSFGKFAAFSLETVQTLKCDMKISGGIQYNTIGKFCVDARPAYFHNFSWGELSAELLLDYSRVSSVNCCAAGAGVGLSGKWIGGKLGYFYRSFCGAGGTISEPFNIYYDLSLYFLPNIDNWDLQFSITTDEMFELERHFQPSFIAQCGFYPSASVGLSLALGCKPAGMFNMSADYYQSFLKLGVCYRW